MITLDLAGAAELLGIHPDTCRERAKAGAIPGAKIGRAWRFIEADLIEYIRSQYAGAHVAALDYRPAVVAKFNGSAYVDAAGALDALLGPVTEPRRSLRAEGPHRSTQARFKSSG